MGLPATCERRQEMLLIPMQAPLPTIRKVRLHDMSLVAFRRVP